MFTYYYNWGNSKLWNSYEAIFFIGDKDKVLYGKVPCDCFGCHGQQQFAWKPDLSAITC